MTERDQRLLELVRGRAGDAFRAALRYDADDWQLLYVRDDVATDELRSAIPSIVERSRAHEPTFQPDEYDRLGDAQASVELYDQAAVVHLREDSARGLLVSLDRDVAQGLGQFVAECTTVLTGE